MTDSVTILHTNDLHGALTPARAAWLAALKADRRPALLLDSGDAVTAGNLRVRRHGEPVHRLMNQAGYDAGALGNRESYVRARGLASKLQAAAFPILCANLRRADGGPGPLPASVVVEPVAGVRIGLVAVLVPMVRGEQWTARFCDLVWEAPLAALRRHLPLPDVAAAVCLSHLGLEADRGLAAAGLALDLILGGHSHTPTGEPERRGRTWIAQNPPHGRGLSELTLTFTDRRLSGIAWRARTFEDTDGRTR